MTVGPLINLALKYGPAIMESLSGNVSSAGGVLPQNKSKFGLSIENSMNNPNRGFSLGLKDGTMPASGETLPVFTGETTVTGESPVSGTLLAPGAKGEGSGAGIFDGGAGSGGDGGGGPGGGGLPPWMDKLNAGMKVGEALRPQMPRPPSLPGGGRGFDPSSSILQFLQSIGRR
jgi:hypothetical protein